MSTTSGKVNPKPDIGNEAGIAVLPRGRSKPPVRVSIPPRCNKEYLLGLPPGLEEKSHVTPQEHRHQWRENEPLRQNVLC
jgi:hypothetical protein